MASRRCDHYRMFHDRLCPSFGGGTIPPCNHGAPLPTVGRLRSWWPGDPCGASLRTCRIEESGEPPSITVRAGRSPCGGDYPRTLTFSVLRQGHRPCGTSHRSGSWLAQRPAYRASCELGSVSLGVVEPVPSCPVSQGTCFTCYPLSLGSWSESFCSFRLEPHRDEWRCATSTFPTRRFCLRSGFPVVSPGHFPYPISEPYRCDICNT